MHHLHSTGLLNFLLDQIGFKKKKHSLRDLRTLFWNTDFNFDYFANFNFAHFEIEEGFALNWLKLQNSWFHLQISISGM